MSATALRDAVQRWVEKGFAFDRRHRLFVSEAAGGAVNASSASSYRFDEDAPALRSEIAGLLGRTLIGIALYYYPRNTLPLVTQYLAEGNNPDQPGRLVQWLYPRQPVLTWSVPGIWYDIGSKETLEEANRIFARR